jgi:hypothetical protein
MRESSRTPIPDGKLFSQVLRRLVLAWLRQVQPCEQTCLLACLPAWQLPGSDDVLWSRLGQQSKRASVGSPNLTCPSEPDQLLT